MNRVLMQTVPMYVDSEHNYLENIAAYEHCVYNVHESRSPEHSCLEFLECFEVFKGQNLHLNHSENNEVEYSVNCYEPVQLHRSREYFERTQRS